MSTGADALLVREVLLPPGRMPVVKEKALFKESLEVMQRHRLGVACITAADGRLLGVITAGDVCRMLLRDQKPLAALFADDALLHATHRPVTVSPADRLIAAVKIMEDKQIWDLPVVDGGKLVGLLHLHPAVKALLGI